MSDVKIPGWLTKVLGPRAAWKKKIEDATGLKLGEVLGCGHYGCAFRTSDGVWVVKITRDSTEGPMQAKIGEAQRSDNNYGFDGFTLVKAVFRLDTSLVWRGKESPIYVIVREDIVPLYDFLGGFNAVFGYGSGGDAIVARLKELSPSVLSVAHLRRSIDALHKYKDFCAKWYEAKSKIGGKRDRYWQRKIDNLDGEMNHQLSYVSDSFPYLGEIMGIMQGDETPLRDLHANNIGVRVHGGLTDIDPESGIGNVVAFDPGHSPYDSSDDLKKIGVINPVNG